MSKFVRNRKRAVIAAARDMLDYPYKLGGWGGDKNDPPNGIDCRGLVQMSFKAIGARHLIGDYQMNVRRMHKWAVENGRLCSEGHRGDVIIWNEPAKVGRESDNPLAMRHTGIQIQPVSRRFPQGLAISAVNPRHDVKEHDLLLHDLGLTHLDVLDYIHPDWESLLVEEPPMENPEPPIA
jgi:hypothetical protein